MTFEGDRAKIQGVIERARRGDETLSNADVVAAVDEFDGALSFRINAEGAALGLLEVVAQLCLARPNLRDELLPVVMWAWGGGDDDAARFSIWLEECSQNPTMWQSDEEREWLRATARDTAGLEKWFGTVRVWIVQSQTDA